MASDRMLIVVLPTKKKLYFLFGYIISIFVQTQNVKKEI